uniref:Kinetochore protein NDC80 n=1 Tax=Globisporangium ultimum (strain ATCC 200006 / CBS 805.95 / DAOM BR144) TaxID=431595 RepID=K3WJZ8_GLOUD
MRRTTLGPISSSQLNTRTSVLSNPSARISLGATKSFARQSIGPVGTASRRVSTAAHGVPRPPPTAAPRNSISRQSIGNAGINGRRSSVYGGRASMSARGGRADPRPLTDKTYMNGCIHALIEFLSDRQYDHVLSPKILKGPSKKDFYNIILFLFRQVDPTFEFGVKFEEDVATQLKTLRYPFAISKTALVAVGSPHTWPALLGSIAWVIELLSYDEIVQRDTNVEEFDGENGDKAFFEYLGTAYRVFLAGDDDQYNELEQREATKIDSQNQVIRDECSELERANEELKRRIEQAKSAKSSLPALNSKKADCLSDLEKFKKLVAQLEAHQASLIQKIQERDQERLKKEHELQARQREIQNLTIRIESQELSAEDVEQMSKERARLNEQCHLAAQRQKEIQSNIWRQETTIAEQMDAIENLVKQYSITATNMKLLPVMAKNTFGVDYEIEIDAHTGGVVAAQQLSQHLKQHIRPALLNFKKNRSDRRSVALDEVLQLQGDVEHSRAVFNVEYQKEQTLESKAKKMEDTVRREREAREATINQKLAITEDVELQIESILNEKDIATQETQSRQQFEALKKSYVSMTEKYSSLIEKNRHEVANALVSCTDHKETIEQAIASQEKEVEAFWS